MKKIFFIENNNIDDINNSIYAILLPNYLGHNNKTIYYTNMSDISFCNIQLVNFLKNIKCDLYSYINFEKITMVNLNVTDISITDRIIVQIYYDMILSKDDCIFYFYCYDSDNINNVIMKIIFSLNVEIEYI